MENLIGKYVIVRDNMAGVFFGILEKKEGTEITLKDARKFYRYSGANTVEDLADKGAMRVEDCKLTVSVRQIVLSNYCQIHSFIFKNKQNGTSSKNKHIDC